MTNTVSADCSIGLPMLRGKNERRLPATHLHDFILEFGQKPIHDLILLDGQRVQIDLFHAGDFAGFDQATQFRHWLPFLLLGFPTASTRASSSTPSSAAISAPVASRAESTTASSASSASSTTRCVSHLGVFGLGYVGMKTVWR